MASKGLSFFYASGEQMPNVEEQENCCSSSSPFPFAIADRMEESKFSMSSTFSDFQSFLLFLRESLCESEGRYGNRGTETRE
jgi:hypothetical protein